MGRPKQLYLLIKGAPGSGKSKLAKELRSRIQSFLESQETCDAVSVYTSIESRPTETVQLEFTVRKPQ